MPGELVHVLDEDGGCGGRGGAAYPAPEVDELACRPALEWAEEELLREGGVEDVET
jgi:hypothetical protein